MKHIAVGLVVLVMSFATFAGGNAKGGDEFRKTAVAYERKAQEASSKSMHKRSDIYSRLAEIKREAAVLADQGKWSAIDWSEYHALNAQLSGKGKTHKKQWPLAATIMCLASILTVRLMFLGEGRFWLFRA